MFLATQVSWEQIVSIFVYLRSLFCPSFLKDIFTGYRILAGAFFFQHFISLHSPFASLVSEEMSVVIFVFASL